MSTLTRRFGAALAFACGFLSIAPSSASAQAFFDGPPGTTRLFPTSINAANVVAGWYLDGTGASHGFVRDPASAALTTFSLVPCTGCLSTLEVTAINAAGTIAGDGYHPAASPAPKGFVCAAPCASVTEVNLPAWGAVQTPAINDSGVVAGTWNEMRPPRTHGYVRDGAGNVTTFDAPASGGALTVMTHATAINGGGDIAGTYFDSSNTYHVFLRNARGEISTYDIRGSSGITVTALTSDGTIAGHYSDSSGDHGFTITTARHKHLASFDYPGASHTFVTGANNLGALVGYYTVASGPQHAFLRDAGGTFINLDVATAAATVAQDINEHGVILGYYIDSAGAYHGFIR